MQPLLLSLTIFTLHTSQIFAQDSISTAAFREQVERDVEATVDSSIGKNAPPLRFHISSDTSVHQLSDFAGRVVLLNFWNRGCKPCIAEMPDLSILQDEYENAGLRLILLGNDFETQNRFFTNTPVSGIKARIVDGRSQAFLYRLGVVPTLVLIDRNGLIKDVWLGTIGYDAIEKRINTLIPRDNKSFRFHNPRLLLFGGAIFVGLCIVAFAITWNLTRRKAA